MFNSYSFHIAIFLRAVRYIAQRNYRVCPKLLGIDTFLANFNENMISSLTIKERLIAQRLFLSKGILL